MQRNRFIHATGLALAGLIATAAVAQAQVTTADVGVNPEFTQTAAGVSAAGGFFSARAFFPDAADFTMGTVIFAGSGSPQTLIPMSFGSPNGLGVGVGNTDFTALQAAFPNVDYMFDLSGGSAPETTFTIPYEGDAYSNTPELTAASFMALQGMNVADPVSLEINGLIPNSKADANFIFFSIINASGIPVYSPSVDTDATEITIPGGTLSAGQTYSFDLLYSARIVGSVDGIETTQFYDTHTDGTFSTEPGAVPEPSTWAMLLIGFAGMGYAGYRSARKTGAAATVS
jgi:PEP-CTERM motif